MTNDDALQAINAAYTDTIKNYRGEWSAEAALNVKLDLIDQLIHAGITGEHKSQLNEVLFNDNGAMFDLSADFPEFYYQNFLPRLKLKQAERKEAAAMAKVEPDLAKLLEFSANYSRAKADGAVNIEALKQAAPIILKTAESINEVVSPKAFDVASILRPTKRADIIAKIKAKPDAIETSYPIEDDLLRFQTGAFSVVAAPTGHAKTTFLTNIFLDLARLYPGKRHWLFSYEEDNSAIHVKALNIYCDCEFSRNNKATITQHYKGRETALDINPRMMEDFSWKEVGYWELVEDGRLNIVQAEYSAEELMSAIRAVATDNCGVVMIDYIQLLYLSESKGLPRTEELKQICLKLKDLAIETGLCVIAAGQFNREVAGPKDMAAQKLSDASDIEKAANKIIGLWNGDKLNAKAMDMGVKKGMMYLKVLKARDEASDIDAVYPWDGNRGVIRPEIIPLEVPEKKEKKAKDQDNRQQPQQDMNPFEDRYPAPSDLDDEKPGKKKGKSQQGQQQEQDQIGIDGGELL